MFLVEMFYRSYIMKLNEYCGELLPESLLRQVGDWQRIDKQLKKLLPSSLADQYAVARVSDGNLVVCATTPIVAHRLKILLSSYIKQIQAFDERIEEVIVKVIPKVNNKQTKEGYVIGRVVLAEFAKTADDLKEKCPDLSSSIQKLINNHERYS